jgi:hypothetical protein
MLDSRKLWTESRAEVDELVGLHLFRWHMQHPALTPLLLT